MVNKEPGPLPLTGIRILDLTHVVAGPFGTTLLADAGAELLKIEIPRVGELRRKQPPFVSDGKGGKVGLNFLVLARNRQGIALDLKKPKGKELFKELVKKSDVVVENFTRGTMRDLGLDYPVLQAINPRIIYAALSGFGATDGPYSDWRANAATIAAMSGVIVRHGPDAEPLRGGLSPDPVSGLWAAYAILLALHHRNHTGVGQFVDVAMYDCVVHHLYQPTSLLSEGADPDWIQPGGAAAHPIIRTSDGYVTTSLRGPREKWNRLWKAMGREDLVDHPDFDPDLPGRVETVKEILEPALEGWFATRTKWETATFLQEHDFSAAPVQTREEVVECPQLESRRYFVDLDLPAGGTMRIPGNPLKFSEVPEWPARPGPTEVGEHTAEVLGDLLGLTESSLDELRSEGVV